MHEADRLAMTISLRVRISKATRHAAGDEHRNLHRQGALARRKLILELLEVHAADQLHGHEKRAVRFAEMISLNDVRVNQVRDQPGFADEIINKLLLVGVGLANDFDGHALYETARAVLFRFVNDTHAAFIN